MMIEVGENIVDLQGEKVSFFYEENTSSAVLNVWFPGAYNREKGLKQFQRYTWLPSFEGSFLIFDDPTINASNTLSIGWFQGRDGCLISKLKKYLDEILDYLGFEESQLRFFGSSAGGFVSLKFAELFPGCDALVINPQVSVLKYYKSHVENVLRYSYQADLKTLDSKIVDSLTSRYLRGRQGRVFYFQNKEDVFHYNKHLPSYTDGLDDDEFSVKIFSDGSIDRNSGKLFIIHYSDAELKHTPPNLEGTRRFFQYAYGE